MIWLKPLASKDRVPVFQNASGMAFQEAVAVTFLDNKGTPIHGGFYAVADSNVYRLVLRDTALKIDSSREPRWTAQWLSAMLNGLVIAAPDQVAKPLPWSTMTIKMADLTQRKPGVNRLDSPGRNTVFQAYTQHVAPLVVSATSDVAGIVLDLQD